MDDHIKNWVKTRIDQLTFLSALDGMLHLPEELPLEFEEFSLPLMLFLRTTTSETVEGARKICGEAYTYALGYWRELSSVNEGCAKQVEELMAVGREAAEKIYKETQKREGAFPLSAKQLLEFIPKRSFENDLEPLLIFLSAKKRWGQLVEHTDN